MVTLGKNYQENLTEQIRSLNMNSLYLEHFYSTFTPPPITSQGLFSTLAHPWDLSWSSTLSRKPAWAWRQGRSLLPCLNSAVWPPFIASITRAFYMCLCNYLVYVYSPIECKFSEGRNLISGYPLGLKQTFYIIGIQIFIEERKE